METLLVAALSGMVEALTSAQSVPEPPADPQGILEPDNSTQLAMFRLADGQAQLEGGIQAAVSGLGGLSSLLLLVGVLVGPRPLQGFHVLLAGMSVVDLLHSLVVVGYSAYRTLNQVWLVPRQACLVFTCLSVLLHCLKTGYLFLLSCDRFTLFRPSHAHRFSVQRMAIISGLMWLVLFVVNFMGVFLDPAAEDLTRSVGVAVLGYGCGTDVMPNRSLTLVFFQLFPIMLSIILYIIMAVKVFLAKPSAIGPVTKASCYASVLLFATWLLCYLPHFLLGILLQRLDSVKNNINPEVSRGIVYLSHFSFCLALPVMAGFPALFKVKEADIGVICEEPKDKSANDNNIEESE